MKRFCPKCGAGTDYTVVKPSFCGRCGSSYEGAIAAAPAPTPRPVQRVPVRVVEPEPEEQVEYYDEEGNARETNFDPNDLQKLEVQIIAPPKGRMTYGELGMSQKTSDSESVRTIPKKVNRKAIVDELLPNRHASKQQTTAKKAKRG